uniref:Proteinase-activated receptor 1 n=1 Tax=Leptobrachium leishanense TaxID=445787 RepID=A0A8C5Q3A7_9ANUR
MVNFYLGFSSFVHIQNFGQEAYSDLLPSASSETINHSILLSNYTEYISYLSSPWLTTFIPSTYTLVSIVALPLNIMAIIIFLFKTKLKKPAMIYMLNLAAADLMFVSVLPFKIAYHVSGNNWIFGSGMCSFVTAAYFCNMFCSVLLMTAISMDRFLGIVFPIHSLSWRTVERSFLVCFLIWVTSVGSTVPLLVKEQTQYITTLNITTCHDVLDLKEQQSFYIYYFSILCLLLVVLPLIITTISYSGIIYILRFSTNIKKSGKKTRALLLILIVFCIFLICFGPSNVILLMHYLHFSNGFSDALYFAYSLCISVSSVSCCLDPLIYYYVSPLCQSYVYRFFCCKTFGHNGQNCERTIQNSDIQGYSESVKSRRMTGE